MRKTQGMTIKDQLVLASWLQQKLSLDEVMQAQQMGLVGNARFSNQAIRAYQIIWSWSAIRLHGEAGENQARFEAKCGKDRLNARISRVNLWVHTFLGRN